LLELLLLLFPLLKKTVKTNVCAKNSVIHMISYALFIKKNKRHLEIFELDPFSILVLIP
jgi:hypothetical protein